MYLYTREESTILHKHKIETMRAAGSNIAGGRHDAASEVLLKMPLGVARCLDGVHVPFTCTNTHMASLSR